MAEDAYWLDTGTPQAYLQANVDILPGGNTGQPVRGDRRRLVAPPERRDRRDRGTLDPRRGRPRLRRRRRRRSRGRGAPPGRGGAEGCAVRSSIIGPEAVIGSDSTLGPTCVVGAKEHVAPARSSRVTFASAGSSQRNRSSCFARTMFSLTEPGTEEGLVQARGPVRRAWRRPCAGRGSPRRRPRRRSRPRWPRAGDRSRRRAAQVQYRAQSGRAERDVGDSLAPHAAEGVGDEHGDVDVRCAGDLGAQSPRRSVGVVRAAGRRCRRRRWRGRRPALALTKPWRVSVMRSVPRRRRTRTDSRFDDGDLVLRRCRRSPRRAPRTWRPPWRSPRRGRGGAAPRPRRRSAASRRVGEVVALCTITDAGERDEAKLAHATTAVARRRAFSGSAMTVVVTSTRTPR